MHRFRPESLPAKIDSSIPKEFTLKNTIVVWSRVTERHAGVEPTCCWFWIKKRVNTSDPSFTLLLYHTKIFHASRKKPLRGEQLLSGRKYSDSHSVLTLRGNVWYYYIMPLCFMQTESRRPQPRSTAHCERISESTSTSTPKRYENKFRNHYCYAITICFWHGARAPRRHVSSHSQQWIGSCHSITRRCRRGYFDYE